jgi:hypothetical protein
MSLLGDIHGMFDVNEILRSERTISRHVMTFAETLREQIKEILSIPLKEHSLTICPDYWSDSYKKISYLGVSVVIIDSQYNYKSIDLCCKRFEYEKKTAENTLNVRLFIFSSDVLLLCRKSIASLPLRDLLLQFNIRRKVVFLKYNECKEIVLLFCTCLGTIKRNRLLILLNPL